MSLVGFFASLAKKVIVSQPMKGSITKTAAANMDVIVI